MHIKKVTGFYRCNRLPCGRFVGELELCFALEARRRRGRATFALLVRRASIALQFRQDAGVGRIASADCLVCPLLPSQHGSLLLIDQNSHLVLPNVGCIDGVLSGSGNVRPSEAENLSLAALA